MADFRALCAELHAAFNTYAVDEAHHDLLVRTEAALAQPNAQVPTDKELLELMPALMFRVALSTAALEYARAVLDRWGGSLSNAQNQGVPQ